MTPEEAVEEYQCSGCVGGPPLECYEPHSEKNIACKNHVAGTMVYPQIGRVFLGMPKGFNRFGCQEELYISIFRFYDDMLNYPSWGPWSKFGFPVWKYLDPYANTIIRGVSPRISNYFIHIYLENVMDRIDCIQITNKDIEFMD
jgi:hypothetical protein